MQTDQRDAISVGRKLREERGRAQLTLEKVSALLHVPVATLEALEADTYDHFPAKVYAAGVLKKYAALLSCEDIEGMLNEFSTEWDVRYFHVKRELTPLPENRGAQPFVTPRRFWVILASIILLGLFIYIGFRVAVFVRRPPFTIEYPPERSLRFSGRLLEVKGSVERESSLTVNGREITIDSEGNFSDAIELRPNRNTLEFVATNRFGKVARDVRYVLVE